MFFIPTKKNQSSLRAGFSFVELLVVMAVIGILSAITAESFRDFTVRQQVSAEANDVMRGISEQRSKTTAALNNSQYGFRVGTSSMTLFSGTTYVPGDPDNEVILLSYNVATSSFSNGLDYLYFGHITGTSSATGTISLYNTVLNSTTTITIYGSGVIE